MGKMGRGAEPVREEETEMKKKSRLAAGNWAKRAKGIQKSVSNFQNLRSK
jgi:hypothetical protein